MRVKLNPDKNKASFLDLTCGTVFHYAGTYYMKIEEVKGVNAVRLMDGTSIHMSDSEKVEIIRGSFVED